MRLHQHLLQSIKFIKIIQMYTFEYNRKIDFRKSYKFSAFRPSIFYKKSVRGLLRKITRLPSLKLTVRNYQTILIDFRFLQDPRFELMARSRNLKVLTLSRINYQVKNFFTLEPLYDVETIVKNEIKDALYH